MVNVVFQRGNTMPWNEADVAGKTKKATSATARRQWVRVANSVLARTGNDARAVRAANAVIARRSHGLDGAKKFSRGGPVQPHLRLAPNHKNAPMPVPAMAAMMPETNIHGIPIRRLAPMNMSRR